MSRVLRTTSRPLSRDEVAEFSRLSNDPNPLHVDPVFARAAGFPDIVVQGTFSFALAAEALNRWAAPRHLARLQFRLLAPVPPETPLRVEATPDTDGELWQVHLLDPQGRSVASGQATFQP